MSIYVDNNHISEAHTTMGARQSLRDKVIDDPVFYRRRADRIYRIIKEEFTDRNKLLEPRPIDDTWVQQMKDSGWAVLICFALCSIAAVGETRSEHPKYFCVFIFAALAVFYASLLCLGFARTRPLKASGLIQEPKKDQ